MPIRLLLFSPQSAVNAGTPITGSGLHVGVDVAVELAGIGMGWTTISEDVLQADDGIVIKHGIEGSSPSDRVAGAGTATFTLDNSRSNSAGLLGYYSLHHSNKRSGWDLNIGCRIRLQDPATSTWYTKFIGKIDIIDVQPWQYGQRRVHVTAVDWMDDAARWALVPEIGEQEDKRGDEVLTAILARMPQQPVSTSFDQGREIYPRALDQSASAAEPALSEFYNLAASEFGYIFLKGDGTLRYESRYTRLQQTSSAWTIADTSEQALDMPSGRDRIINTVRVTVHPKIVDAQPTTVVYSQANTIRIAPAETKMLLGEFRDPVTGDRIGATDIQALSAGTDYIGNSDPSGAGADLTDKLTITVNKGPSGARFSIVNTGSADVHLTRLQLRGSGIYDRGSFTAEDSDGASVGRYGEHAFVYDMPYQTSADIAQGAAGLIKVSESAEVARPHSITVFGKTSANITQLLTRDISDRVTVQETVTGVNNDFFINGMELQVLQNRYLRGTLILGYVKQSGYWMLGTSTLGSDTLLAPL